MGVGLVSCYHFLCSLSTAEVQTIIDRLPAPTVTGGELVWSMDAFRSLHCYRRPQDRARVHTCGVVVVSLIT